MQGKLYSFSPSGQKLSQVGDDGMIRIWDAATGVLEHEYQPASHLLAKPSCIHYSPSLSVQEDGGKAEGSSVLAVGTLEGTVLVYSPEKRELLATLNHSQPQAVLDISWCNHKILYTLSADNTLAKWNIISGQKQQCFEVSGGSSLCAVDLRNVCVAKSSIEHLFVKKKGGVIVKRSFTGHTSRISQLIPLRKHTPARYFVSYSCDDRFVYAWDLQSESDEPVASFMVGDQVCGVVAMETQSNTVSLLVVTLKGFLMVFTQSLTGNSKNKVVKRTGRLHILQEGCKGKDKVTLPILAATFTDDSDKTITFAYGNTAILKFEQINAKEITSNKQLYRSPPAKALPKKSSITEIVTPKMTSDTTIIGPGHLTIDQADQPRKDKKRKAGDEDGTLSLPMDERLNALVLDKPMDAAATQPPKADNQIHLLLQGLHSKDVRILQGVLSCSDDTMITNTVRRLPTPAVVPLLKHLNTLVMGKGHKSGAYVKWVRLVLYHHMSHLSTLPDRQELLRPFYSVSASRVSTFMQLTELHARLDLCLTHVATKHQEAQQSQVEPTALLVYKEEESDSEEEMEIPGGISESEDNWEELSDFGELNGHTDSESDFETLHRPSKRTLQQHQEQEGEVEIDDDDEEEEEEEASSEGGNESEVSEMTVDVSQSDND